MANKKINSVNLLPEFLRTEKNAKFLSSTIDQLIQRPELERLNGYVGSTQTPTYNSTADVYLNVGKPYQLDPALVTKDDQGNIQRVQGYDDLINEISVKGGFTNNLDRLFRSDVYSYNSHVDWDKLVNFQYYHWMPNGPELLEVVNSGTYITESIVGRTSATVDIRTPSGSTTSTSLSNGMMICFGSEDIPEEYYDKEFFVEGVGTSIVLVDRDRLIISEEFVKSIPEPFDSSPFDNLPFDNDRELTLKAEYVTINRASKDLNPWTRYNRWVHQDVIRLSAELNGVLPIYPSGSRAQRPIIEFKPNIQLLNFGKIGLEPVDLFDTEIENPSALVGSTSTVIVDGIVLEEGHRVVFSKARTQIFEVRFVGLERALEFVLVYDPTGDETISVLLGDKNNSTDWWFNGVEWIKGQERTKLNQAPLFELYDTEGRSYSDRDFYLSDFKGNKIFSYVQLEEGTPDKYLGFPVSYRNTDALGSILFENNLVVDNIVISQLGKPTYTVQTNLAYCKINQFDISGNLLEDSTYENAWVKTIDYPIPLLVSTATGLTSYYEEPLSLTNNPLNGNIPQFTISELSEHVQSMINRGIPQYATSIIGAGNLRDLSDFTDYGIKLISSANPISFAQMFIGKKENCVIDAIDKVAGQYNQFKNSFLNSLLNVSEQQTPAEAVDAILTDLNQYKNDQSPYFLSDMVGYGNPEVTINYTVTTSTNTAYPLETEFDLDTLSLRSVLVYLNNEQLLHGVDYIFNKIDSTVEILSPIATGDLLVVKDYKNTEGAYIPPTPTKLGMYPIFEPKIYEDDSFVIPTNVIQGHDGSITVAYGDYRDAIILELEKRIFNNIKSNYNPDLLDINSVIPGVFRTTDYSAEEIDILLGRDFARWSSKYSIDYISHKDYNPAEPKTWNYKSTFNQDLEVSFNGSWRAIFKKLYDTDRPHTNPWEMLGFSIQPNWWEDEYGTNYGSDNPMWVDLELGRNANTDTINSLYARPGLGAILPVDVDGNLRSPNEFLTNLTDENKRSIWKSGEQGPAETAWRRSSYYPYAVQRLLALTIPATYTSLMYDPSRVKKNISNQWTYGENETFFKFSNLSIFDEHKTLTSGYSVFVSEVGSQRNSNYVKELRTDLAYADYNLFYKVNGFVDKDTLQIIVDAFEPTSTAPGSVLPAQNYELILNSSNPIRSVAISGIVVQKQNGEFVVKGYDQDAGYFNVFRPIRNLNSPTINVGGISEEFVKWEASGTGTATGLTASDTITANSSPTGHFYQKGQLVQYGNNFYRVTVAHRASATFNPNYFQILKSLPTKGGASVQIASTFEKTVTQIPYGISYKSIQEVYDLMIGYGRWLTIQGFEFSDHNPTLESVIDWNFSAKEFLFWTTQKWADGSVITLSPFADRIVFKSNDTVVANLFDSFYQYSIARADGTPFPQEDLSVTRLDDVCTISTLPETDGIYFARLNLVQKEHAVVFDNETIFSDTIYNPETGSRQRRIKLVGFRTAGWNGDFFSPGFVYDTARISNWSKYTDYKAGDVVRFSGNYYSAIKNTEGTETFDFTKWDLLNKKPVPGLLPNFDYKIGQFEDFYSVDSDNFDANQQDLAQHLTGYTPRPYLNNIFPDPVAQYKFYQGFIREKGTKNAVDKLSKASLETLNGEISYNEEWAFRLGDYGSFPTYTELEVPLVEGTFLENPQVVNFVEAVPEANVNDLIHYSLPSDLTIKPKNYSVGTTFLTTSSEDVLLLTHSGYVRIDDVTVTAYNENSLLDIANSSDLKDGDTIWLGFKQDGSWDVYRYTYSPAAIIGVFVSAPLSDITFTTQYPHGLSAGQLIGVTNFNSQVDGIYRVKSVNGRQFTVPSELASIENAPLPVPGQLYKFVSARVSSFDSLPDDKELLRLSTGTKFWVDPSETDGWKVFEKIDNYSEDIYLSPAIPSSQSLGYSISNRVGSDIVVVGAPGFVRNNQYGRVYVYQKNLDGSLTNIVRLSHGNTTAPTEFGYSVVYDDYILEGSTFGLTFAGAPSAFVSGSVKISTINPRALIEGTSTYITNPDPTNGRFGASIFVERNTSSKIVIVGAPGGVPNGTGAAYAYRVSSTSGPISVTGITRLSDSLINLNQNSQWGYSISGADDASVIAIGAPGYFTSTGVVTLFDKSLQQITSITSPFGKNGRFGETVKVSPDGTYLIVSAPSVVNDDDSLGKVAIYKIQGSMINLDQVLENPVQGAGMKFGSSIDIKTDLKTIAISALGTNRTFPTTFDGNTTLFDGGITKFTGTEPNSGAVYIYNQQVARFVLGQELFSDIVATTDGTNFGKSVVISNNEIYVGAPAYSNTLTSSAFYKFNVIDDTKQSWSLSRSHDDLVDVRSIQKVTLIDTLEEKVVEYLDVIDPLKGKIAGIAEQELTYKLVSDPAIYSIGVAGTNNDTSKNWLDDHVGELWWDLSSTKYIWYEQSDFEYRRNNWGKLFPGSTIDVYEWIGSSLLPTEWASQADTPAGLTNGISGQPKYPDNSVISVKQVYDPITNSFSNVYYYWVKNKVTVPNAKNRRISSYEVASIIADPKAYGLKFISVLSNDAVAINNVGPILIDDRISLNIAQNTNFDITLPPRHTEWLLLQEGNADSTPPEVLENKMIFSLLGHDNLGNLVPDPSLSLRTRYGISIRPQQSMFKNRLEALRNVVEFSNSVLKETLLTGKYSFKNLNAQEEIPSKFLGKYDFLVEDNTELSTIDTSGFSQAIIECQVNGNGEVANIEILESGYGYGKLNPVYNNTETLIGYQGPTFETVSQQFITTFDGGTTTFDKYTQKQYTPSTLPTYPVTGIVPGRSYRIKSLGIGTNWNYIAGTLGKFYAVGDIIAAIRQGVGTGIVTLVADEYVNDPTSALDLRPTEFTELVDPNLYGRNLEISSIVDENGSISDESLIKVLNPGKGYSTRFRFLARPQTAYVVSDSTYNGKWTKFEFDYLTEEWSRSKTQGYNTPLYWDYIDWSSSNYDDFRIYSAVVGSLFELGELDLLEGQYVKVNNGGDGRYVVLEKLASNDGGNYGHGYDIVYSQRGTIQIKDSLWDLLNSGLGWDYLNTYDETLWDQTPDIELQYILKALKNDIFIDDLKINWNLLFFKAVKYAFSEQKMLDWAFKTSFITVHSDAGELNQPPIYKLQNTSYYEDYLNEVKPYHTQIRNFITNHDRIEDSRNIVTDFDFPAYYDTSTNLLVVPTPDKNTVDTSTWRMISSTLKFDRISYGNTTGDFEVTDTFISNGNTQEFILNWVPNVDRATVVVRVDGIRALYGDYTVETYTEMYNGYHKRYGKIVFQRYLPENGQVVVVEYEKDAGFLNAIERVMSYQPDTDLNSVITGLEFSGINYNGSYFTTTNYDVEIINSSTFTGIDPSDLEINGGTGFLSPITGYGPEELVPGTVVDSLGISVYTKGPSASPIILTGRFNVITTSTEQRFVLSELPPTIDSLTVILSRSSYLGFDDNPGRILTYVDGPVLAQYEYRLDWETKEIIIPEQYVDAVLSYSIIGVGSSTGNAFGYMDKGSFYANNTTGTVRVDSLYPISLIQDALVTVDGVPVSREDTTSTINTTTIYFKLLSDTPNDEDDDVNPDQNAFVRVYNLSTTTDHLVQAWFFAEDGINFNEIKEQTFEVTSQDVQVPFVLDIISTATMVEPLSSQVIVEITDAYGTRRLLSPDTNYYSVTDVVNPVFPVVLTSLNTGSLSVGTVRVYNNGSRLADGDYSFTYPMVMINTATVTLQEGDAIAIESLVPEVVGYSNTFTNSGYDYRIEGNLLWLAPESQIGNSTTITNATIKVVAYNDRDSLLSNRERFVGNPNRRFRLSRPVLNTKYVWVTVFKKELIGSDTLYDTYGAINGVDFIVLDDNVTVQFSDNWAISFDDIVEITSFRANESVPSVIGYRIFSDMFGGTTFTRLSKNHTTYLTRPLRYYDTEIHVADESVLTPPDLFRNIPGVIMIDGERIEFMYSRDNVLSQLRRGTLGTGPAEYLEVGTRVLDQGQEQIISGPDLLKIQNTFTSAGVTDYTISPIDLDIYVDDSAYSVPGREIRYDGIVLRPTTGPLPTDYNTYNYVSDRVDLIDQVEVYYGGHKLNKDGYFKHDTTIAYDSIDSNAIVGSVELVDDLPEGIEVGRAYLVTSTNQVWVFNGLRTETTSTRGYVYSGLDYIPADFSIEGQVLKLNTATISLREDVQISIVKKEFTVNSVWNEVSSVNSTVALIDSDTAVARFLKESPAELPDNYYYGGDLKLTDENGEPLTDYDDRYITGYN